MANESGGEPLYISAGNGIGLARTAVISFDVTPRRPENVAPSSNNAID
jgi:hypothetical protein